MKPRRTHVTGHVLQLEGGTEDNDLWVTLGEDVEGNPIIVSTWQPTDAEREQIAAGANVELIVWGGGHPPVCLRTSTVALGKPPEPETA